MSNTAWKYYLLDYMGRPYRKENGVVVARNDIKPLKYTPNGWQDISIAWERDMTLFGEVRNFTLPLKFVIDGADILRSINYNKNFDEKIFLLIQKEKLYIDPTKYYFYYDFFYKGEINLPDMEDEETEMTVTIAENGLAKDLKANMATNYELLADEVTIKMDGFPLYQTGNFSVIDGLEIKKSAYGTNFFLPVVYKNSDGQTTGMEFTQQQLTNVSGMSFADKIADKFGFANGTLDITQLHPPDPVPYLVAHVEGKFSFKITVNDLPFGFRMRFLTSELTLVTQDMYDIFLDAGSNAPGSIRTCSFAFDIPVRQLSQLHLEGIFVGGTTGAIDIGIEFQEFSDFTVAFSNTFRATYIKGNLARTTLDRLAQKLSPGCVTTSALLDGLQDIVITSFDAVRGLDGAVVKTNYGDYFKSINAVLNAGTGVINNKLTLESKEFYFKDENVIPLGAVKEPKQTWLKDQLVNTVSVGYLPQDVNSATDINGRQEFNTTAEYSTNVKKAIKKLELISEYRADPFGIENARLNLAGKKTTADSADNDVCFLGIDHANPQTSDIYGVYYNLKRVTYDVVTGLLDGDKMFNIEYFSPARMRERHRSWLNSLFYGFEGQELHFETLSRNRELYTKRGSEVFDEDSNMTITDTPRVLKTIVFDVIPEAPEDLVEQLEANPCRCFSFIHPRNGLIYKGFNHKIGIAPNTLNEQAFLLISTASNDLQTLTT